MVDQQADVCEQCGKRRRGEQSTSLTQWLFSTQWCMCEYNRKLAVMAEGLCSVCGRRMTASRSGSLTQWLFKYDLCTCNKSAEIVAGASAAVAEAQQGDRTVSPEELGLDNDNFPLERYEPHALLGRGAAGRVFRAYDRLLKKRVAIKTLNKVAPDMLLSFQNEARAMSLLNHKNIISVLDFGATSGGNPYMVMEFANGHTLEREIKENGALPWRSVVVMAIELCDALSHAHGRGVSHRDLKSSNIMIDPSSEKPNAKIIDFGIALSLAQKSTSSQGLTISGTPQYMSPDQARGLPFDARSEIYSFGCVLFEALTGKLPFQGNGPLETMRLHAHEPVPTFADVAANREVPQELEEFVRICLEKEPEARYGSFDELRADLETLIQSDDTLIIKRLPESAVYSRAPSQVISHSIFVIVGIFVGAFVTYSAMNSSANNTEAKKESPKSRKLVSKQSAGGSYVNQLSLAHYADEADLPEQIEEDALRNAMDKADNSDAPLTERIDIAYELMDKLREDGRDAEARKLFFKVKEDLDLLEDEVNLHSTDEIFVGNAPGLYLEMAKIDADENPYAAEKLINKALVFAPFHEESAWVKADLLDHLAIIYMRTGRREKAIDLLKEAIRARTAYGAEGEDENDKTYDRLAEIYDSMGKTAEANAVRAASEQLRARHASRKSRRNRPRTGMTRSNRMERGSSRTGPMSIEADND